MRWLNVVGIAALGRCRGAVPFGRWFSKNEFSCDSSLSKQLKMRDHTGYICEMAQCNVVGSGLRVRRWVQFRMGGGLVAAWAATILAPASLGGSVGQAIRPPTSNL